MILRSDRRLLDHAETNAFASVPGFLGWRPNKNKMKQSSVFPGRGYFPPLVCVLSHAIFHTRTLDNVMVLPGYGAALVIAFDCSECGAAR